MNKVSDKLTVYFEEPFWVGVFEKVEGKKLSVSKVTFGTEPKDYEVYEFLLKHYYDLQFSPSVTTVIKEVKQNPKRRQREVKKQLRNTGIGTKSQQALKLVCIPSSRQLKKYKIFVLPGVYRATFLCRQSLLFMKFHWC